MARSGKVSSSYARAFFDSVADAKAARKLALQLEGFARLVMGHKELKLVLCGGFFSEAQRRAVTEDLCDLVKADAFTRRALLVMSQAGSLREAGAVADKLRTMALAAEKTAPIVVESAVDLDEGERTKVATRFEKVLAQKVEARFVVVPSLLGGVRVRAMGRTYDGSLKGQLERLGDQLV